MTDKPTPRDHRQEVTDDIIRMLESGTAPWQKPWKEGRAGRLPMNLTTGKPYRGGNVLCLMIQDMRRGYGDNRWMTYKQAAEKGWQVRKGEKGSHIEYWESARGKPDDGESEADKPRSHLIHRIYTVFNAQQVDGVPAIEVVVPEKWDVCEAGERILQNSGAEIVHAGERAYYNRGTDRITLPPKELFADAPGYYGVALHELGHWTGHEKRLNRETLTRSKGFDQRDELYAREELIAELASLYVAAETGIPHDPSQHAAYVDSWLQALKKDKNEIFRAASAASAATDYVLTLEHGRVEAPEPEAPVSHAQSLLASRGSRSGEDRAR